MKKLIDIYKRGIFIFTLQIKKFWMDFGWFSGTEFKLFEIIIYHPIPATPFGLTAISFLQIQLAKFIFGFGIDID